MLVYGNENGVKKSNFQDAVLNSARKNKIPCTIHLIGGHTYANCMIVGFDNHVVVISCRGKDNSGGYGTPTPRQYMVYKHAIASVSPARPIEFGPGGSYGDPKPYRPSTY